MTWHPVVNEWNTWEVWFRFYLFHPFYMISNFLVEKCSSWYWEASCLPPTSVFPRICRFHLTSLAIHHNRQQTYLARSKKGLNFSARPSKHISGWSYMQDSGVRSFLGFVSVLKEKKRWLRQTVFNLKILGFTSVFLLIQCVMQLDVGKWIS